MVGTQGFQDNSPEVEQRHPEAADGDVWAQLIKLASSKDSDPVLRLLVSEAYARHKELRGVTATIATRYRSLVDAIPDAVVIHDESGNVLDVNESACRLYRAEREFLLKSSIFELNPALDPEFLATLCEAQQENSIKMACSTISREDGTTKDVELLVRKYSDTGRTRVIAVVRDLGLRETEVQQLRESESWLRGLMHEIDMGVIVWSRRGQIISSNPSACRSLQVSEVELRAMTPDQLDQWRFIDATGSPIPKSTLPWIAAVETGKPQEMMTCGVQLPNMMSTLWLSMSTVPHFTPGDVVPDTAACLFTEVTKLQRDALMFAQSQTLNATGAWQLDFDTQTLLCSAQVHVILDLTLSTPITKERLLSHFHGHDLDRFRHALANVREGGFNEFEAKMTTSIGRTRHVRIRVRPDKNGTAMSGIFGTLKDITNELADPLSAPPI